MKRFIVLLRGVNVSGKNILPMKELREQLTKYEYKNVQTYIQSGNIVLDTELPKEKVVQQVKDIIFNHWGYDVAVLAKNYEEMYKIVQKNPYQTDNHKILAFVFLNEPPIDDQVEIKKGDNEEFTILNDVVYLYCPGGFGTSKLSNNIFEKKLKVSATTRNYKTTMKLLELAKPNQ